MLVVWRGLCQPKARPLTHVQSASVMWSSKFEDPLRSRQEIDEIRKTPEYERKVNVPLKAALRSASCSMFRDPLIQKFTNTIQLHSNAQVGENIMLETYRRIKETQLAKLYAAPADKREDIELSPTVIIKGAIENCRPVMRLEKVKVGAVIYYVPAPITESRSFFEAIRWLHQCGRWHRDTPAPGKENTANFTSVKHKTPITRITIADGLAKECCDAFQHQGRAINMLYEHHKLCEQNRAYAHYRRTK